MKDKKLKGYLQQSLGEEVQPKRLEETIKLCTEIVREQEVTRAEPRTGFFHYLSDVFRFEGIPIFGLQAVTLFIVCLTIASIADVPKNIPIFMPLFVVAKVMGCNMRTAQSRVRNALKIMRKEQENER